MTDKDRKCLHCGAEFVVARYWSRKRFCSRHCTNQNTAKQYRDRKRAELQQLRREREEKYDR